MPQTQRARRRPEAELQRLLGRRHLRFEPGQIGVHPGGGAQLIERFLGAVALVQRIAEDAGLGHAFQGFGLGLHLRRLVLHAAHGVTDIGQSRAQTGERLGHADLGAGGCHLGFHHLFLRAELFDAILQLALVGGELLGLRGHAVVRLLQRIDLLLRGLLFAQSGACQVFALRLQRHAGVGFGLVGIVLGSGHLVFQRDAFGDHIGQVPLGVLQRGDHFFVRQIQRLRRVVGVVEKGVDAGFENFSGVFEQGHESSPSGQRWFSRSLE